MKKKIDHISKIVFNEIFSHEEKFMLQKNVTAVAYVGDNSRNFEYQKRYQQILYKNWLIGKNENSILKILSHC